MIGQEVQSSPTGALDPRTPHPGDWLIAREVFQRRAYMEGYNYASSPTPAEVIAHLATHPITDEDIANAFGPQSRLLTTLIRQAATLTPEQTKALSAAYASAHDTPGTFRSVMRAAVTCDAARRSAGEAAWNAARDATRKATRKASWGAWADPREPVPQDAWDAGSDAALALSVADLVGQHGLDQQHLDRAMAPWIAAVGDPRTQQHHLPTPSGAPSREGD